MLYLNPQAEDVYKDYFFEDVNNRIDKLSGIEKEEFEERASIMEYDGQLSKEEAEWRALRIVLENRLRIAV